MWGFPRFLWTIYLCVLKQPAGGLGVFTKTFAQTEYRSNSPGGSEVAKHGSQLHLPSDLTLYMQQKDTGVLTVC